ncbi:MAG: small multi-drug export protein [Candidatus Azambacteria bacterium]|nr:small multi-drug export protein [Candidatus Azambacteria bacterium]
MLDELITFFSAALPILELRWAIPFAIIKFGFNPYKAYAISVLGNMLPILPILLGLERVSEYLSHRFYRFNRFFNWLFERTRRKHSGHFTHWGDLALFIFVAIPFPLTGAYSGAVAAFVFGIPVKHAFWSIVLGVLTAGAIVSLITVFGENIFRRLFFI